MITVKLIIKHLIYLLLISIFICATPLRATSSLDIADEIVDDWDDVILESAAEEELQQKFFSEQRIKYKKKSSSSASPIKPKRFKNKASRRHAINSQKQGSVKIYTQRYQLKPYKSPLQSSELYQKRYRPR